MSNAQRILLLAFAALLAGLLGGCATTHITSAWSDPDLAKVPFRKVLVVFQHPDPALRRTLERNMAAEIGNAVPAHAIFSDEEVRDVGKVRQRLREQGFDSSVVMRIVAVERDVAYYPGGFYPAPYYRGFYGYWGYGWGMVYDPGYYRLNRTVRVATNVYSVPDDKLVWAAESETFNPASMRDAVDQVVAVTSKATGEALKARG
jgi:hypothetical protein